MDKQTMITDMTRMGMSQAQATECIEIAEHAATQAMETIMRVVKPMPTDTYVPTLILSMMLTASLLKSMRGIVTETVLDDAKARGFTVPAHLSEALR